MPTAVTISRHRVLEVAADPLNPQIIALRMWMIRCAGRDAVFTLSQLGHSQTRFLVRSRTTSSSDAVFSFANSEPWRLALRTAAPTDMLQSVAYIYIYIYTGFLVRTCHWFSCANMLHITAYTQTMATIRVCIYMYIHIYILYIYIHTNHELLQAELRDMTFSCRCSECLSLF